MGRNTGNGIIRAREHNQMSQEELASGMKVSRREVEMIEQGLFSPDDSMMLKLSEILHVSVHELVFPDSRRRLSVEGLSTPEVQELWKLFTMFKKG